MLLRSVESGAWRVMRKIESSLRSRENENFRSPQMSSRNGSIRDLVLTRPYTPNPTPGSSRSSEPRTKLLAPERATALLLFRRTGPRSWTLVEGRPLTFFSLSSRSALIRDLSSCSFCPKTEMPDQVRHDGNGLSSRSALIRDLVPRYPHPAKRYWRRDVLPAKKWSPYFMEVKYIKPQSL